MFSDLAGEKDWTVVEFEHAPFHHVRLVHDPQAGRVLRIDYGPDVDFCEWGIPQRRGLPARREHGVDGFGRVTFAPSTRKKRVSQFDDQCGFGSDGAEVFR